MLGLVRAQVSDELLVLLMLPADSLPVVPPLLITLIFGRVASVLASRVRASVQALLGELTKHLINICVFAGSSDESYPARVLAVVTEGTDHVVLLGQLRELVVGLAFITHGQVVFLDLVSLGVLDDCEVARRMVRRVVIEEQLFRVVVGLNLEMAGA